MNGDCLKLAVLSLCVFLIFAGCIEQGVTKMAPPGEASYDMMPVAYSNQQVTKQGIVTIKVAEGTLADKFQSMKTTLKAEGAITSDETYNEYGDRKQYTITIRIPPTKFEKINSMLKEVGEVKELSVQLEDVTKQYDNLDIKIKNRELELERLYELYNKSNEVTDILEVEKEVTRVEIDLEELNTEKAALVSKVELSTVQITIYEENPATQQLSLSLEGLAQAFFGALAAGITVLVLGVGFALPLLLIGGIIWFGYKQMRKKPKPRTPEHSRIPPPK